MNARLRISILSLPLLLLLLITGTAWAQISPDEYASRRAGLRSSFGDGLYYFRADVAGNGRQDPNFNYLTGIQESGASLLMLQRGDESREIICIGGRGGGSWEAAGLDAAGAQDITGAEIRPVSEFDAALQELLRSGPTTLISELRPASDEMTSSILDRMSRPARRPQTGTGEEGIRVTNPGRILSQMRGVKSAAEIELLQIASDITRLAHIAAMKTTEPGMNEFEIQAVIEYTFKRYGAARPGFSSIVGSGPNSLVLHWSRNDRFAEAGDVIVIDIGAEYFGYTSDVTRTIPVSGRFTAEQREIYEIVLAAHEAAQKLAEVEGTPYSDLSRAAEQVLAEGLARLGLIESPGATMPGGRGSQLRLYYFHGLGHGIGLVVHDSMPRNIGPGSCFTIEPGIYVRPTVPEMLGQGPDADALREKIEPVVRKYQNIGVRIEDSYAFTENGLVRLSAGTPRTIAEVEAMMAEVNWANSDRDAELVNRYRKYVPPEG